jgi:hypothetical protein
MINKLINGIGLLNVINGDWGLGKKKVKYKIIIKSVLNFN